LGQLGDGVNVRVRENDWEGGVQQRLVTLALEVRTVNDAGSPERAALLAAMSCANDELISILDELREISRGIHPAILSQSGLGAALRSLARRASVPTVLDIRGIGGLAQACGGRRLLRRVRGADQRGEVRERYRHPRGS
jgi:signal transduction histidine kinase